MVAPPNIPFPGLPFSFYPFGMVPSRRKKTKEYCRQDQTTPKSIKTNPRPHCLLFLLSFLFFCMFCYNVQPFSTVLLESQIGGPSISHRLRRHTTQKKVNSKNTQRVCLLWFHSLHALLSTCTRIHHFRYMCLRTQSSSLFPERVRPSFTWPYRQNQKYSIPLQSPSRMHTLSDLYHAPCIALHQHPLFLCFYLFYFLPFCLGQRR